MTKLRQSRTNEADGLDRNLLLRMEPELQLLRGSVQILRSLGETADAVEPIALATLAHYCGAALSEVDELWRACLVER
jgi:hypothetical protein